MQIPAVLKVTLLASAVLSATVTRNDSYADVLNLTAKTTPVPSYWHKLDGKCEKTKEKQAKCKRCKQNCNYQCLDPINKPGCLAACREFHYP